MAWGGSATRAPPKFAINPFSEEFLAPALDRKMETDAVLFRFPRRPAGLRRSHFLYGVKCSEKSFSVARAVSRELVQRLTTGRATQSAVVDLSPGVTRWDQLREHLGTPPQDGLLGLLAEFQKGRMPRQLGDNDALQHGTRANSLFELAAEEIDAAGLEDFRQEGRGRHAVLDRIRPRRGLALEGARTAASGSLAAVRSGRGRRLGRLPTPQPG
jgi:hypothetical protein